MGAPLWKYTGAVVNEFVGLVRSAITEKLPVAL
jgi:hypothetical protein